MTPEQLGLAPHPEGGHFRETWRAPGVVTTAHGDRSPATAILYLLQPGERSDWHRVRSGELWLWQGGGPMRLRLGGTGAVPQQTGVRTVGPDGDPQHLVHPHEWQAAEPVGDQASLVACVVSPGFDFEDFELSGERPMSNPVSAILGRQEPGTLKALRLVALAEGVSFAVLIVSSVLKRTTDLDLVPIFGTLHGCLFIFFLALVLENWSRLGWRWYFALTMMTVGSPGAHFALEATEIKPDPPGPRPAGLI